MFGLIKKNEWTIKYTLINMTYFAAFCSLHAYAAVYLLDKGFTNTQIGILLAVANGLSAILQPVVAGIIDEHESITNRMVIIISSALVGTGALLLLFLSYSKICVFLIFAIIYMVQFVYQPVMTALCFEYMKYGCDIKYGLARGSGSVGFALASPFLGRTVERLGVDPLMTFTFCMAVIYILISFGFKKPKVSIEKSSKKEPDNKKGLLAFIKEYPQFIVFVLGSMFLFFTHNLLNDFLIQVIRNLGGSEKELGYATFLQALLELPTMVVVPYIIKRVRVEKIILVSAVAFLLKSVIMALANNLFMMYLSQSLQLLAYAAFIPGSAYYVDSIMKDNDKVKGQAYVTCAITAGGVFSNLICGRMIDKSGIGLTLVVGCVVSLLGLVIMIPVLSKKTNS